MKRPIQIGNKESDVEVLASGTCPVNHPFAEVQTRNTYVLSRIGPNDPLCDQSWPAAGIQDTVTIFGVHRLVNIFQEFPIGKQAR